MFLFGGKKKEQELAEENERLKAMLSPEQKEYLNITAELENLRTKKQTISDDLAQVENQLADLKQSIEKKRRLLTDIDNEIEINSFGIYKPTYVFANSSFYKDRLADLRNKQKEMIKAKTACRYTKDWKVNGDTRKGRQMVADIVKLLLRAFNLECDNIVENVKISNFEKSIDRINTVCDQISKLGAIMDISISERYKDLKVQEVKLALDFRQKKQVEKEEIRELKRQQREEAKLQKEIEEERKKLKKEQAHYTNALNAILEQIKKDGETADLIAKKAEFESHLTDTETAIQNVDYREANKKAGYVYVISNIGAFGENKYKIGMTRRLDPQERVDELSDASVPFNYDVHAMIFSDNAPALEAALHKAFEKEKVNKINPRKEFFNVTLDEIKKVVSENYDKTVEWVDFAEADQYRQSVAISKKENS